MSRAREKKKILLVDDSETVLILYRLILKGAGYELAVARDGREGIGKALALRPDLILLDVIMPNMNGFETLRELRLHEETRRIPIVMVTTNGEEESMETGYTNGCNDYVIKPIDSLELLTKVRSFLHD